MKVEFDEYYLPAIASPGEAGGSENQSTDYADFRRLSADPNEMSFTLHCMNFMGQAFGKVVRREGVTH